MQDKIEVGEYVRTKKGDIDKIDRYIFESNIYHCENGMCIDTENRIGLHLEDIVKHSKNIIKLIEADDYINGYKVISIDYDVENPYIDCIELDLNNNYQYNFISINQIKSIVTKEQFENIVYKIGE